MKTDNYRVAFKLPANVGIYKVLDTLREVVTGMVPMGTPTEDLLDIRESVTVSCGYEHLVKGSFMDKPMVVRALVTEIATSVPTESDLSG